MIIFINKHISLICLSCFILIISVITFWAEKNQSSVHGPEELSYTNQIEANKFETGSEFSSEAFNKSSDFPIVYIFVPIANTKSITLNNQSLSPRNPIQIPMAALKYIMKEDSPTDEIEFYTRIVYTNSSGHDDVYRLRYATGERRLIDWKNIAIYAVP